MANAGTKLRLWVVVILAVAILSPGIVLAGNSQGLTTRTMRTMCRAYLAYGQYDKARTLAETAAMQAQREGAEISERALCLIDLGTVYSYENMLEDAAKTLSDGIVLQKQALGEQHPYVAHTLRMLSDVYRRQDRLGEAEVTLEEAFSIMLSHTHMQSQEMTSFLIESAQLASASGRFDESRKTYETAQQMAMDSYGPNHLYTAQIMQGSAEVALACGDLQNARDQIGRSIQLQERFFGTSSQMLIGGWLVRARIERVCGAFGESEVYLQKAIVAAQQGRNVVTMARVYEKVGAIRGEGVYTASLQ